jgi:hypothetical protein
MEQPFQRNPGIPLDLGWVNSVQVFNAPFFLIIRKHVN